MMKYFYTILFLVASSLNVMGQSTEKIWKLLLNNQRKEALQLSSKINPKKANIESLVLRQIVRNENGHYRTDDEFIPNFVKQKDFEKYLYAIWKEEFMFSDYLNGNFNKYNFKAIQSFQNVSFADPTIKSAITYVSGLADKYTRHFDQYEKSMLQLNSVFPWQYCATFENLNRSGLDIPYPPEKLAYSKKDFNANSNGKINWFTPNKKMNLGFSYLNNFEEYGSGIDYAQTFFKTDKPEDLIFKLASGGKIKMWIDDILVLEEPEDHITEMDAYATKVHLPAGNHRVLIKTENAYNYFFILRVFDQNNHLLSPKKLGFTDKVLNYQKPTKTDLNPQKIENPFEVYFKNLKDSKISQFFKDYMLILTYLRNQKSDLAKDIILKYLKKYPKSTFIKKLLLSVYSIEGDDQSVKELQENIKKEDPESPYAYLLLYQDTQKLIKMPLEEMKQKFEKISDAIDLDFIPVMKDFYVAARTNNITKLKEVIDNSYPIIYNYKDGELISLFASFYSAIFNETDKSLKLLREASDQYFSPDIFSARRNLLKKTNKIDDLLKIDKEFYEIMPDNYFFSKFFIDDLIDYQKYNEALTYINRNLELFPYSFHYIRKKGDALLQLKNKKEALQWYEKSFSHDTGNYDLRKKIQDLKNESDPFSDLKLKKPYDFISKNRGKKRKETKKFNILLSQHDIQLYDEGGNRIHRAYIYEVNSQQGIESLKEIDLGLQGNYIINKSEIVKPDGKIVPAEKSGSSFVFNNLSVGDVVYIDYEKITTKTGRFYKDFYDKTNFTTFYPMDNIIYRIITSPQKKIYYQLINGKLPVKEKKNGSYKIYEWKRQNVPALPESEPYRPNLFEFAPTLYISTIKDWKEISNWYSDLVKPQIKYNHTVNELFDKLFPQGTSQLSDIEKARRIYNYITDSLTYSYVSFKQSGFVPQKPSKTIKTKLGDCKDYSTLFVTLGRKAGLKTNIVLVSTSDYGKRSMLLPAIEFNHAIVRIFIDGKEHYQELTNKYLPFGSTPNSLIDALALNIPWKSSQNNQNKLFLLNSNIQTNNRRYVEANIQLNDDTQNIKIVNKSLNNNDFYREMFSNKNTEKLKKRLEKYYEDRTGLDLNLSKYQVIKNDKNDAEFIFNVNFTADNTPQKIGKLKLYKIPRLQLPYTKDIISTEKRHYPIQYRQYENIDYYETDYTLELKPGQKFVEIPDNVDLKYKEHHFQIKYLPDTQSNKLKVVVKTQVDFSDITPEEYPKYKEFVKKVLEATDALVGYK